MDAISLDEWELLPDHKSFLFMGECSTGHSTVGGKDQILFGSKLVMINMDHFCPASHPPSYHCIPDEEAKKPVPPPWEDAHGHDPVTEFRDIGVTHTEPEHEKVAPKVTEILISDAEGEMIRSPAVVKDIDQAEVLVEAAPDNQCGKEEAIIKKTGFSVGNLRVNGVGALCSFGVAAATFCIFLFGGMQQQKRQNHRIQLQMYVDDQKIQQVVQQASRLNQTMSSVMGGASSPRASISFGGCYHGF